VLAHYVIKAATFWSSDRQRLSFRLRINSQKIKRTVMNALTICTHLAQFA